MPRPTTNSSFSIAVVLIAVMMVIPTAVAQDSTFNASRKTTKDFDVNYKPDAGVAWDTTINQMEPGFKTNLDTWGPFIDAHDGKYVGGMSPEQLIAVNATGVLNNITAAGLHSFTPHDVMGAGMSEGWVRSPIQQVEDAEVGMDVYHVQNPQFANLVPGLGVPTVSSTAANWTSDYNDTGGSHWEAGMGEFWDESAHYSSLGAEAFYPFHEGVFDDFSGNGYNPTTVNAVAIDGAIGVGADTSGLSADAIEVDNLAFPVDIFDGGGTMSAFVNHDGLGNQYVIDKYCGEGWLWLIDWYSGGYGAMRFEMRGDTGLGGATGGWYSDHVIPINEWTHIAVTYNKDSASNDPTFYMNGISVPLQSEYNTPLLPFFSDTNCDTHIGSGNAGSNPLEYGIDEVGFWSSTLTQPQIQTLSQFSPPVNGTFVLAPANNQAGSADWDYHDSNMMGWDDEASTDGGALGLAPKVWANKETVGSWCPDNYPGTPYSLYCLEGNGLDSGSAGFDASPTGVYNFGTGYIGQGLYSENSGGYRAGSSEGTAGFTEMSVGIWVNYEDTLPNFDTAFSSGIHCWGGSGSWYVGGFCLGAHNNDIEYQVYLWDGATTNRVRCTTNPVGDIGDLGWHHESLIWDGTTMTGYLNGVSVCTDTVPAGGPWVANTPGHPSWDKMSIGLNSQANLGMIGDVDEAFVYDTAISEGDLESIVALTEPEWTYADGLVGQWLLGEGSGSVAYDTSGNANHGATTDATYAGGYIGGGMFFDGTGDYVYMDNSPLHTASTITMSLWFKCVDCDTTPKWLFSSPKDTTGNPAADIFIQNNKLKCGVQGGLGVTEIMMPHATLEDDLWYHAACSYDGTTQRLYLNGVFQSSGTNSGPIEADSYEMNIGRLGTWGGYFEGFIDEVMIWNRTLSSYEIYNLYLGSYDLHENEYYVSSYGSFAGVENAYVNPTTVVSLEAIYSDSISENYPGRAYMPDDTNTSEYSDLGELAGLWLFDEGYGDLVGDSGPNANGGIITNADYCPGQYTKVSSDLTNIWCFNEGTGTDAYDSQGSDDGTITGMGASPSWSSGYIQTGLDFDGVNDFVDVGDIEMNGLSAFSISAWTNDDTGGSNSRIISKDQAGTAGAFILWVEGSGDLSFKIYDGASWYEAKDTGYVAGGWQHIVGVFTGTSIELYVDGVWKDVSVFAPTTLDDSQNEEIVIGCHSDTAAPAQCFDGEIDEVTLWDTDLSAAEVLELYELTDPGGVWTTGQLGSGLAFDGVGDYGMVADASGSAFGGHSAMTWNVWLNPDDTKNGQVILDKHGVFRFYLNPTNTFFGYIYLEDSGENGGFGNCLVASPFGLGSWQMLTVTYDSSNTFLRYYDDGVEFFSCDLSTGTGTAVSGETLKTADSSSLCIGSQECDGIAGSLYSGRADEVAIYSEALSGADILELYGMSQSRFQSGQMAYWPFDYGTTYPGLPMPMDYPWWSPECVLPCLLDHSKYENTAAYGDMWTMPTIPTSVPDCRMQNNHCLFFDGSHNYVTIPDTWHDGTTLNPESITISHWIKRGDDGGSGNPVTKYGQYATEVWATEDCGGYFYLNGAWRDVKSHDNSCTDNVWHHVVITFNEATCTRSAYIDGVLKDATTDPTVCELNTIPDPAYPELSIGRWTGATQTFDGNIDEVMIWSRALSDDEVLELYDTTKADCVTYPLTCNPKPQSGHITHFEVWGSNTNDLGTATMEAEWFEGVDYYMSSSGGRNMLQLSATVPYYKYWWWMANMSNEYQSTPILHSVMLEMELFTQPYTLVPNPLSDPDLCWSNTYDTPDNDDLHEFYLDGNGVWGRHYLNFKCPIYAGRDVNADSLADDAYLFVFSAGGGKVNDTFELWLSQSNRGLDFMKSWAYIYDIDKLWMNDTLPLSLGSDVFFTRGMNHGITGWEMTAKGGLQGTAVEFYTQLPEEFSAAEDDELTFHLPFETENDARCCQTALPLNKEGVRYYAQVAGYTSDFAQTGITTSTGVSYLVDDTLLISGMDGVGADGRWLDTTVLDGASILRFRVTFEECLFCHLPLQATTVNGHFKVYSHDANSDFDGGEDSNFFNKFIVYGCAAVWSFTGCEKEEHIDFTVVHHVSVGSGMWEELTTGLTNNAPVGGPKYLYDAYISGIYEEAEVCINEYFDVEGGCIPSAQLTEYQIEYIENFNEWGEATEDCFEEEVLDFSTVDTSSEVYYCAKWAVWDTPIFIAETIIFIGEETGWTQEANEYLYDALGEPNIGGYVTFKEIYALLNFQDGSMWEAAWLVGAFAEGIITVVVTVLQDNINLVSNFLVTLTRFMVFLFIMGSIIGSTSILHHALHGRWSIVNYKCATTLSQSAGFLSAVPYVGGGMASVTRAGTNSLNRYRPPLRKPAQKDRRTNR